VYLLLLQKISKDGSAHQDVSASFAAGFNHRAVGFFNQLALEQRRDVNRQNGRPRLGPFRTRMHLLCQFQMGHVRAGNDLLATRTSGNDQTVGSVMVNECRR
jgi:hypothetical protein